VSRAELELNAYIRQLEEHLRLVVFGGVAADPEAAVLLVRGALAAGDPAKATELAAATEQLMAISPGPGDMAAASAHVRGLVDQDPAALEWVALTYSSPLGRAWATEDAGMALAQQGNRAAAAERFREAHTLYCQLDATDSIDRIRARLRATGNQVRHWRRYDRPAFGWNSLTDTERRIVYLVAQGLSNRQIAGQMFLSAHTIAFHLRRVFCKLDVTSRVQLASVAAEQGRPGPEHPPASRSTGPGTSSSPDSENDRVHLISN
jgi:DNA-binding CsgD family transcriptional regulator